MLPRDEVFKKIATDLMDAGVCVIENALPVGMTKNLKKHLHNLQHDQFKSASVGRGGSQIADRQIRRDSIHWIDANSEAEKAWLEWMDDLQHYLNRHLYLGLFSFESHFSHYAPGDFYEKHCDAFKGQANRVLSVVTYLNENWQTNYAGELLIYGEVESGDEKNVVRTVSPEMGTMVVFLSEQFPHEVLPANEDRYSIAGWFRVNGSRQGKTDPPR